MPTTSSGRPSRPAGSRSTTLPTNSSSQPSAMSVANAPGITQLTRTCGAYSWANAIVSALRPFFDAAYIASGGLGRTAPMLEMFTIEPPPAAAIRAPATAISRNGPLRLTSMVLSKSPSETRLQRWATAGRCRRC